MKLIPDKYSPDELPVNYVKLCIIIDKPYKSLTLQDFDELRFFIFVTVSVKTVPIGTRDAVIVVTYDMS